MKIVVLFENQTEAQVLTPEQLELIRRGVAYLYNEAIEDADQLAQLHRDLYPDCTYERKFAFRMENDCLDRIEAIEQLRAILYRTENYKLAKEA